MHKFGRSAGMGVEHEDEDAKEQDGPGYDDDDDEIIRKGNDTDSP